MSKQNTKTVKRLVAQTERLKEAIHLLLDAVDYETHSCKVTEMVGAVLPKQTLDRVRKILRGEIV